MRYVCARMSGGGEIVGDIAQGALLARAVEPTAGEGADGHTHESACLNCATPLTGSHCHACGQAAHVHRTLAAFFHDLLHGVFHFEGKIWRTLPMLAWRPGQLTREYIDGRRASYVSPIALFLFVVFLTFALFNALNTSHLDPQIKLDPQRSLAAARESFDTRLATLAKRRSEAQSEGRPTAAIDREVAQLRQDRGMLGQVKVPQGEDDAIIKGRGAGGDAVAGGLNAAWRKVKENPALLLYKLQTNAYKYSWGLIPLSVPFLWLLFPFSRRFHLYDHTVFVTYSISFMLMLVAVFSLLVFFNLGALTVIPVLYAPLHVYRQLKGAYGLTRGGALWRTVAVLWFAGVALSLFAAAVISLVMRG